MSAQNTDVLEDLPIHFQVSGVREDALEVFQGMNKVPNTIEIHPNYPLQGVQIAEAVMPLRVTISANAGNQQGNNQAFRGGFAFNQSVQNNAQWPALLHQVQTPMTLRFLSQVSLDALQPLVVPPKATQSVEIAVFGDATFNMLASLVQAPLSVKKIALVHAPQVAQQLGATAISAKAFSGLLRALCKVPRSSKLAVFEIPSAVREIVTGDPVMMADAMIECRSNPAAARILKLEATSIPAASIPQIDPKDAVILWLPTTGVEAFIERTAVQFPRQRLVDSSGFIRNLLKDNPEEERIPLPLDTLKQRSVSADALAVTAQLLQHCRNESLHDDRGKPVWTAEFQEVYEAAFLPLLEDSDIPAFRRQQALKLFGEILELGRYLELRVAYEFGLVGGVGAFSKRIAVLDSWPEEVHHRHENQSTHEHSAAPTFVHQDPSQQQYVYPQPSRRPPITVFRERNNFNDNLNELVDTFPDVPRRTIKSMLKREDNDVAEVRAMLYRGEHE